MRDGQAGFTLVELIVSLAIFALVAVAGLALVDGVLGIESRTGGRLERLADVERAAFVIRSDLTQAAPVRITGTADSLSFARPLAAAGGLPVAVRYGLAAGTMGRTVTVPGGPSGTQRLLDRVTALRFRYWTPTDGWVARWPPADTRADEWPRAVEAELALAGQPGGRLRRVVELPVRR